MTRAEAKLVLQAIRPNGADADHPDFAEALALVGSDPELKAWWEAQQAFDQKVAAKLAEVPVPDDLRGILLAGRKIEPFRPRMRYASWLAAAAVIAFLCVASTFWEIANFGPVDKSDYTAAMLPLLGNDSPDLALTSDDRNKLIAWLKQQGAPIATMPSKMESLSSLGCQKYVIHGHMVSLVCFSMADGTVVHLFTIEKDALNDPPADNVPEYNDFKGWKTAAWSDRKMSYLLATQGKPGVDTFKQLL